MIKIEFYAHIGFGLIDLDPCFDFFETSKIDNFN